MPEKKKKALVWAAAGAAAILLAALCIGDALFANEPFVRSDYAMSTYISQTVYGKNAEKAAAAVAQALCDFEDTYSLYIADSQIAAVNTAAGSGEPVEVSSDVFALLERALALREESGGAFDVTIAPLTLLWDISGSDPSVPDEAKIEEARALCGAELLLDRENSTALLPEKGQAIDLGAIAKGEACRIAQAVYEEYGVSGAVLSIGGNILLYGEKSRSGEPYLVGVRDPRGSSASYFASLSVEEGVLSTSGDYERYFIQDGVRYCHILDPQSGYPAQSDLISVSVITGDGALADAMSTIIFLGGTQKLDEYLAREDIAVIAVDSSLRVYLSPSLEGKVSLLDDRYTLAQGG